MYGFGDVDMNDEERRRVLGVIDTFQSEGDPGRQGSQGQARAGYGEGEEIVELGFQLEVKPQFEVFQVCRPQLEVKMVEVEGEDVDEEG